MDVALKHDISRPVPEHLTTKTYEKLCSQLSHELPFQDYVDLIEGGLDSLVNGTLVIDKEGTVVFFSKTYQEFLGIGLDQALGRHCSHVIENSRIHIVSKNGKAEIGDSHRIKGQDMVVQRIPIRRDGEVIGAVGLVMFKKVEDVVSLVHKLDLLKSKVELYEKELEALRSAKYSIRHIYGESPAIRRAKTELLNASRSRFPVLLKGESGTGKELFAHAIHWESDRRKQPFIRLNCAAIPETLLESELFGYEAGAFTGARKSGKPGKFELAHKGTIFLDEISEMPKSMQAKLLRVLQERELERLGGTHVIRTDFRLIAATNAALEPLVEKGKFREDLYYRLNVIPILIPPLRERTEDIPIIIKKKLEDLKDELGIHSVRFTPDALEALKRYCWPGNIRELVNVLERVLCSVHSEIITTEDLPPMILHKKNLHPQSSQDSLECMMEEIEKNILLNTLKKAHNNKTKAAQLLQIHRTALYKKMRKYAIPIT